MRGEAAGILNQIEGIEQSALWMIRVAFLRAGGREKVLKYISYLLVAEF